MSLYLIVICISYTMHSITFYVHTIFTLFIFYLILYTTFYMVAYCYWQV